MKFPKTIYGTMDQYSDGEPSLLAWRNATVTEVAGEKVGVYKLMEEKTLIFTSELQ